MMKVVSILLLALAPTAWSQSIAGECTVPANRDTRIGGFIQTTTRGANGYQCNMGVCPFGQQLPMPNVPLNDPTATLNGNVTLVLSQYCAGFDNNLLGCTPDSWVQDIQQDSTWPYRGCPHCSANTCNNQTASTPYVAASSGQPVRNPSYLRFVELPNAGRTCYMMKCIDTGCQNPRFSLNNVSMYAYVRSNSFTTMSDVRFEFPDPADPWKTTNLSTWNIIDYPNIYACPQRMGNQDANVCDWNDPTDPYTKTYWHKARRFRYHNATQSCQILECQGNGNFPVIAQTSQLTGLASAAVPAEFQNFIRSKCRTAIQGCYNDPTKWKWRDAYQTTTVPSTSCTELGFCTRLYCLCDTRLSTVYAVDTIMMSRPVQTISGASGYTVPQDRAECVQAWCNINGELDPNGVNNSVIETVYGAANLRCAAPTIEYYGNGGAPVGTNSVLDVPVTERLSGTYYRVSHRARSGYLCSAVGYGFTNNQVSSGAGTCYRSPTWTTRTITASNGLLSTSYSGFPSCPSPKFSWMTGTGPGCPSSSPTTLPTVQCVSNPIPTGPNPAPTLAPVKFYQYASVPKVGKQFRELQCYPSRENIRMAAPCTQMTSTQLSDFYGDVFLDQCYTDRAAAFNYYAAGPTCQSGSRLSSTNSPTYEADEKMQNNECDWFRFQDIFKKIASCECENMARISAGSDPAYNWQVQRAFRTNTNTRLITYSGTTLLNELSSLGCTYTFSCSGGSASVMVQRPKFEAYYFVPTMCKNVDWATLKSRVESVTSATVNGGTSSGTGRFGGVVMDTAGAMDITANSVTSCRVKWYTYFNNADKAKWFNGNMSSATPPFKLKTASNTDGVEVISFSMDSASPARVGGTSPAARGTPSLAIVLLVLGVLYAFN